MAFKLYNLCNVCNLFIFVSLHLPSWFFQIFWIELGWLWTFWRWVVGVRFFSYFLGLLAAVRIRISLILLLLGFICDLNLSAFQEFYIPYNQWFLIHIIDQLLLSRVYYEFRRFVWTIRTFPSFKPGCTLEHDEGFEIKTLSVLAFAASGRSFYHLLRIRVNQIDWYPINLDLTSIKIHQIVQKMWIFRKLLIFNDIVVQLIWTEHLNEIDSEHKSIVVF